jgi:hypothetical protein
LAVLGKANLCQFLAGWYRRPIIDYENGETHLRQPLVHYRPYGAREEAPLVLKERHDNCNVLGGGSDR